MSECLEVAHFEVFSCQFLSGHFNESVFELPSCCVGLVDHPEEPSASGGVVVAEGGGAYHFGGFGEVGVDADFWQLDLLPLFLASTFVKVAV